MQPAIISFRHFYDTNLQLLHGCFLSQLELGTIKFDDFSSSIAKEISQLAKLLGGKRESDNTLRFVRNHIK